MEYRMKTLFMLLTIFIGAVAYKYLGWIGLMLVLYPAFLFILVIAQLGKYFSEIDMKFLAIGDLNQELTEWIAQATTIIKNFGNK